MPFKSLIDRPDDEIIEIVREDFSASEDAREEKNERNFAAYRMFHCRDVLASNVLAPDAYRDELVGGRLTRFELGPINHNHTFFPWLRGMVLSSVARQAHQLWPDFGDFYRIDPDDPDDQKAADAAMAISRYFVRASAYHREAVLALLQLHLFDFAILYTGWRTDYSMVPAIVPDAVQMMDASDGQYYNTGKSKDRRGWKVVEVSGWDVAAINTLNFRVDPLAGHDGFDSCEFAGLTGLVSKRRARELVEAGEWDPAAVAMIDEEESPNDAGNQDETRDFDQRLREDESLSGVGRADYIQKRYIRVDWHYTPNTRVVILNKKAVAQKSLTIGYPFHRAVFIPNPGMFSGTSMAEPLIPAQHDINMCLRLLRAQQDRAVNPDSVIDPEFFNSPDEAEFQPWSTGATILLTRNTAQRDGQLARRFIVHPYQVATDLWQSIQMQIQMGEKASAISANEMAATRGGMTATEVSRIASAVDVRGEFVERGVERALVVEPIDRLIKLIHLNVKELMRVRIRGSKGMDWQEVTPDELAFRKSPDIVALGTSSLESRPFLAAALRDTLLAFGSNPLFSQMLKVLPSMRAIYHAQGIDPDQLLRSEGVVEGMQVPPDYVPVLLANGKMVPINPDDDHEAILRAISVFVDSAEFDRVPQENQRLILEHIRLRQQALTAPVSGLGVPSPPSEVGGGGAVGQMPGQASPPGPPPVATPPRPAVMPSAPPQPAATPV